METFAGQGEFRGFNAAETTIQLSQLIELGGKRGKRRAAATLDAELAGWDYENTRLDVFTGTTQGFVQILAAQKRLALATELTRLAESFYRTVSERAEAGKVSPVEQTRAQVVLSSAHIEEERARKALTASRKALVAQWGSETPAFTRVTGSLEKIRPVPPEEKLGELIVQSPEIARWETEEQQRQARLSLERANAIPDLTVFAGGRNLQETNDNAFVAGISIPLPIFDRNQGGIAAARSTLSKARHERRAVRSRTHAALSARYQSLSAAYIEAKTLREQILPAAEQAFEAADLGYKEGKFGFLEVLDAQRTLFEVRGQYIDALAAYHQAYAEVERLVGRPLETVNNSSSHN